VLLFDFHRRMLHRWRVAPAGCHSRAKSNSTRPHSHYFGSGLRFL
jgi:hypothetical protein